eukprot:contig_6081_g1376
MGAGAVAGIRRILELDPPRPSRGMGKRSTRIRLSMGKSQMRLLPSREELREVRRTEFDRASRVQHFFFTRQGADLVLWDYVRGSCSAGIRRYTSVHGGQTMQKRLRAYTNKYWMAPAQAGGDDGDDDSSVDDNGVYFDNDNAETEGCYAPRERDKKLLDELVANLHSYLEDDDCTGELRILAVRYGSVAALQRAVELATVPDLSAAAATSAPSAVLTFAADGGTIAGKLVTAFTAGLAWPHLKNGRTDLTPLAYSLTGESDVDHLVVLAVRDMLQSILAADIFVPVMRTLADSAADAGSADDGLASEEDDEAPRVPLKLCDEVQVCADFKMTHWIHGMTGSGDKWRCVHRAGCLVLEYLRASCQLDQVADRSADVVSEQWHLAIWTMAGWTVVHKKSPVKFNGGEAYVQCPVCKSLLAVSGADVLSGGAVRCPQAFCDGNDPVYLLQEIASSPFDDAMNAARTMSGGVRGYPLLRNMKSRLQLPVLHCTGNIAEVITYFVLECLPEVV